MSEKERNGEKVSGSGRSDDSTKIDLVLSTVVNF